MQKVSTGIKPLDTLLEGGLEANAITTIYGDAGSGKTCICLLCAIHTMQNNKKVIYVDTEENFSLERLQQLTPEYKKVLENILVIRPKSFAKQKACIEKLYKSISKNIGLVIVDSIVKWYRLAMGSSYDTYQVSKDLGTQLKLLAELAQLKQIPIIITSHSYKDFNNKGQTNIIGGEWIKDISSVLIELQTTQYGERTAILKKHRTLPEKSTYFKIIEKGIE